MKAAPVVIKAQRVETPNTAKEEESKEMVAFKVYRRGGRYFVTVGMRTPDIMWLTIPDVIPVEPTAESIAAAFRQLEPPIREALAQVHRGERHPEEDDDPKHWLRMGAKSYHQFLHSATYCNVWISDAYTKIVFMKFSPYDKDFAGGVEPEAKLGPDASYEDVARAVLEVFAKNPPPPDDKPDPPPKRPRKTALKEQ